MDRYRKLLRRIALYLLIVLAAFGIGLLGIAPPSFSGKREDGPEIQIELVEETDGPKGVAQQCQIGGLAERQAPVSRRNRSQSSELKGTS